MPAFKPVTIPAKPATDRLELDEVAFNDFRFTKEFIGLDQLCTISYVPTLFNAAQAAAAENPAKIITAKKNRGNRTMALQNLPMEVLQALGTLQAWLETVAVQDEVLEPA